MAGRPVLLLRGDLPQECSNQCALLKTRGLVPPGGDCGSSTPFGAGDRCAACPSGSPYPSDEIRLCPGVGYGPSVWPR